MSTKEVVELLREALEGETRVSASRALELADLPDGREAQKICAAALRELGWENRRVRAEGGEREYRWCAPLGWGDRNRTKGGQGGTNLVCSGDSKGGQEPDEGGTRGDSAENASNIQGGTRGDKSVPAGNDLSPEQDHWSRLQAELHSRRVNRDPLPPPTARTTPPVKAGAARAVPVEPGIVSYAKPAPPVVPARPPCGVCGSRRYALSERGGLLRAEPCTCLGGRCPVPSCSDGWISFERGSRRCPACAPSDTARRLTAAQIPARYLPLLSGAPLPPGYAPSPEQEHARLSLEWWCSELPSPGTVTLREVPGICLTGGVGSGKTGLAARALRFAIGRGYTGRFVEVADLLAQIRESYTDDSPSPLTALERVDLLVLDELAPGRTDWQREQIGQLLRARYRHRKPTISTSNLPPAELARVLGPALWSRLQETTLFVQCSGRDLRPVLGKGGVA